MFEMTGIGHGLQMKPDLGKLAHLFGPGVGDVPLLLRLAQNPAARSQHASALQAIVTLGFMAHSAAFLSGNCAGLGPWPCASSGRGC